MNYILKCASKINQNIILLICNNNLNIWFSFNENDTSEKIIDELFENNFIFENIKFLRKCLNILLKKNRFIKICNF